MNEYLCPRCKTGPFPGGPSGMGMGGMGEMPVGGDKEQLMLELNQ